MTTETLVALPARAGEGSRSPLAARVRAGWHVLPLAGVLGLAAFLDFFRLGRNGYANAYYAGAVRSMLGSWHDFLFTAFDPNGLVSVDKPPLALWLEAASAKLFGYSGFAMLLPEALAGVASVWLLYLLVARFFGRVAGLAAALALAVSPVSVAVNRDNNPDALFTLLLVAAAYVGARAVESGRLRTLVGAAVLVGLAFNTKMLVAAIVVPGLALAYALFARASWRRRAANLAVAGAVLVVVSGAWIAAIELTPAGDRPWVGSTSDNDPLSLALGYNGVGRVAGQTGGTSTGGGLGGAFSGTPGLLRLINQALGDQGGWLLPLAIVGGLSALAALLAVRRRRELGAFTVVAGWFVAAGLVFSFSDGIIHTYYLSALAPATSGLVGVGAVALWRDARRGGLRLALPLAALVLSAWLEVDLLRRSGYLPWLQTLVVAAAAIAGVVVATAAVFPEELRSRISAVAIGLALLALLAAPAAWAETTSEQAVNGVFPGAGPSFVSGLGPTGRAFGFGGFGRGGFGAPARGGGLFGGGGSDLDTALAYAKAHDPGRIALIVSAETEAAPYVIEGESVAAMGGFTGRETVMTSSYLARLVRSGEARYFLLGAAGGFGSFGQRNAAADLITSTCGPVAAIGGLYDCAGRAAAIAAG